MAVADITPTSDHSRFELHSKASSSVPKIIVKSSHRGEIARWVQAIKLNIEYYSTPRQPKPPRDTAQSLPPSDSFLNPGLARTATTLSGVSTRPIAPKVDTDNMSIFEAADDRSIVESENANGIPHELTFDMSVINIKAQLELTEQLVESLYLGPADTSMQRTPSRQQAIKDALRSSLSTLSTLVSQQKVMTQDREKYLLGRIDREIEARKLWEENMMTVAKQQAEMDRQLTEAARQNERKRKALKQARGVIGEIASLPTSPAIDPPTASTDFSFNTARSRGPSMSISNIQEVHAALAEADSDSDEDEFFDAIETGIPNLQQYESIVNPRPVTLTVQTKQEPKAETSTIKGYLSRKSLEPYRHVRDRLPIDDDKRPSVSRECPVEYAECSVGYLEKFRRQRSYQNLLPGQLQRVYLDVTTYGGRYGV